MGAPFPPAAELVPHRGRALLIDAVLAETPNSIRVAAHITRAHPYFVAGRGVPGWVGIELMAQAAAAHVGLSARRAQGAPRSGLLLGTRRYRAQAAYFPEGAQLEILAEREFGGDGGLSACACKILATGRTLAEATIILMEGTPENPA